MNRKYCLLTLVLVGMTALGGCVSTGGNNLSARVAQNEQQIQRIMSQVGQVEQVLPGQAEMWAQMQTMRQELNILNGKIDELQGGGQGGELGYVRDRVNRIEAIVRQMASQLAINTDSLNSDAGGYTTPYPGNTSGAYTGQNTPVYISPSEPTPGGVPITPSTPAGGGDTAQVLYDTGIKAFDQQRYKDAVVSFKDFVGSFPKHRLAGNAHFWEGESYFQMKDYARAALAYQEVIGNFPGSPKLQSAMLKQGISLYNANKKDAGRERLQELVSRYPSSPEASRAKQFLASNK